MNPLIIQSTENSLGIHFDSNGTLLIEGKSTLKDAQDFFLKLINWVQEYILTNPENTVVDAKILYMNSNANKQFVSLLRKLEALHLAGKKIAVKWHYEQDDETILEKGEDFSRIVKIPFEFIEVKEF